MCNSVMYQDSMFHFLCVCENTALVVKRQSLYDIVIESLQLGGVSNMALADVCLLGHLFDDDTAIKVLNIIYEMYVLRVNALKDNH